MRVPEKILQQAKLINWFPGHMQKSLRVINDRVQRDQIGVVLEVRDARVPLSCINWKFEEFFLDEQKKQELSKKKRRGIRFRNSWGEPIGVSLTRPRRMIIYNKSDLIDGKGFDEVDNKRNPTNTIESAWKHMLRDSFSQHTDYSLTFSSVSNNNRAGVDQILAETVREWILLHRPAFKDMPNTPYPPLTILVTGLPNTGKSSLINALRVYGLGYGSSGSKSKVAPIGKNPGLTRSVSGKIKILDTETFEESANAHESPIASLLRSKNIRLRVYVIDSPGILPPNIEDEHTALKLALVNCLPTEVNRGADPVLLAHYLWWRLEDRWKLSQRYLNTIAYSNKNSTESSMIYDLLDFIARHRGSVQDGNPDLNAAALHMLKFWRDGSLYRRLGFFPPLVYDRETSIAAKNFRPSCDPMEIWKSVMVDDELLEGPSVVNEWFARHYSKVLNGDSNQIQFGDLSISKDLVDMNARDRRRRRKRAS